MLTAAKNQVKVCALSVKYNIMKEMLNKVTFLSNIIFMILNNASFIIQWVILFSLKEDVGGYTMNNVLTLWGIAASTYGISHILFQRAYELPGLIVNGKLDAYLVQPKSVLLGVITSSTNTSAIGDLMYGYIVVCIANFRLDKILLFTLFTILGAITLTAFAILVGSISFWIGRAEMLSNNLVGILVNFATYPDGIFKSVIRFILYLVIPVGIVNYLPVQILSEFNFESVLLVLGYTVLVTGLAILVFHRGLRRYSSSSLMEARM